MLPYLGTPAFLFNVSLFNMSNVSLAIWFHGNASKHSVHSWMCNARICFTSCISNYFA